MDLASLLALPAVGYARLSPDRRRVAFVWARVHSNDDVFVVACDGSTPPVALTHTPEATRLVSWAPDSQSVVVAEDCAGDERARLYRVYLERPGEMQALTEAHPPYFTRGGCLSPDGRTLYYGANYDFENQRLIDPTWIYCHDLSSGRRTPVARPMLPAFTIPELNASGSHLIYARKDRHPAGRQFHLVDLDTGQDQEILCSGDRAKVFARWLPDGQNLLVLAEAQAGTAFYKRLGIYHCPGAELRWLVDDPQRTIEGAWVAPDGLVIVDEIHSATHHPTWIDPATGRETPFPAVAGNLVPLGRCADGAWIALQYAATQPGEVVRLSSPGRATPPLSLTRIWERSDLRPESLCPAEDFRWQAPDGLEIQGWLYRAQPNPGRAILWIHGGPSSHAENRMSPQIQYLVHQGFNLLAVNYRGSTGFGGAYREAIKQDGWGGREQEDIAAGAQALIAAGLAAPGRIGVTGTSFGGYSAWCQITRYPPPLIAAAAPICGMTDLVVDYETTRPDLRPMSEEMMGGSPETIPQRYRERSPLHYVQNITGRLLIVQGARDPNVTPENVRRVVERLQACQIPYDLLVFDDEGHGIYKPANQMRLLDRLAKFFEAALG